jgi:hypothetical protein
VEYTFLFGEDGEFMIMQQFWNDTERIGLSLYDKLYLKEQCRFLCTSPLERKNNLKNKMG